MFCATCFAVLMRYKLHEMLPNIVKAREVDVDSIFLFYGTPSIIAVFTFYLISAAGMEIKENHFFISP